MIELNLTDIIYGLSSLFFGTSVGIYAWSIWLERHLVEITRKISYSAVLVNNLFWGYAYIEAAEYNVPLAPRHFLGLAVAVLWNVVGIYCYEKRKKVRREEEDRMAVEQRRQAADQDPT